MNVDWSHMELAESTCKNRVAYCTIVQHPDIVQHLISDTNIINMLYIKKKMLISLAGPPKGLDKVVRHSLAHLNCVVLLVAK